MVPHGPSWLHYGSSRLPGGADANAMIIMIQVYIERSNCYRRAIKGKRQFGKRR